MKYKFNLKGIGVKFLIPMLMVILTATIGLGVFAYESQKQTLTNIMEQTTSIKVQDMKALIIERQDNMDLLKQAMNKYLISITKGVAESLKNVPDDQLSEEATRIAKSLDIDEIHIIDENGILQWGNVPAVFGYDFNSSDQTKPFLEGLTNKDFTLAQDAQQRGVDGKLFQYIGVARIDKPGVIQIGITPEEMQTLMDKVNIKQIGKESKVGKDGYVFIFDNTGTIISHPDDKEIGKKLADYDWGSKIENADQGSFTYNINGIEKLLTFEKVDQYIIVATIPTSEFYGQLNKLKLVILFVIIFTVILASAIIYFISNALIIKRIKKMLLGVSQIGDGNLNVVLEDNGRDEIGQLYNGLNIMVDNLRALAIEISGSALKLHKSADLVAQASEQTSTASQEIAQSINQIATGTNEQAEEVANSVEQLGVVTQNIDEIMDNTKIMSEKVSNIEKQNKESLNTVNALQDKFTESKAATAKVMEIISMLADKSGKIGEITASITAISQQTNLLALNASIEAARAGESGKGFAVVANEVKNLASQTAKAAQDIGALISSIGSEIEVAVTSINTASKAVGESDEKLISTVATFKSLKESNDVLIGLSNKMNEIGISLSENTNKAVESLNNIAAVSEETAATTEEISASTEEQSASFMEITDSVNGVKELAEELTNMINHFRTE